jgi:hypothetical protein
LSESLGPLLTSVRVNGDLLEAHVSTTEDLNTAIDMLRARGALIESVIPTVSTLEDVFIRTTQGEASEPQPQLVEVAQ